MLTAVIFDFDGIIVDTEPLHYKAFQELLIPLGLGYTWQEYVDHYIGFDDRDAFREAFRAGGKSLDGAYLKELINGKAAAFQKVIAAGVEPFPGVVELIRAIAGNLPLALCSGALRSDIEPILKQLALEDTFNAIVTADEVAASKPDPASYRLAVKKLQDIYPAVKLIPTAMIAVEDTPAGIASAVGAGLQVLAVTNSYPADKLHGASRIIASLAGVDLESIRLIHAGTIAN